MSCKLNKNYKNAINTGIEVSRAGYLRSITYEKQTEILLGVGKCYNVKHFLKKAVKEKSFQSHMAQGWH